MDVYIEYRIIIRREALASLARADNIRSYCTSCCAIPSDVPTVCVVPQARGVSSITSQAGQAEKLEQVALTLWSISSPERTRVQVSPFHIVGLFLQSYAVSLLTSRNGLRRMNPERSIVTSVEIRTRGLGAIL